VPGIAGAAAAGYDAARGDLIVRCDADSRPSPGWLAAHQHAHAHGAAGTVLVTGPGWFRLPRPWSGLVSAVYVGGYLLLTAAALAHAPAFGTTMSMPRRWWREARTTASRSPDVHDDMDLSFQVRPGERVRVRRAVGVSMSPRAPCVWTTASCCAGAARHTPSGGTGGGNGRGSAGGRGARPPPGSVQGTGSTTDDGARAMSSAGGVLPGLARLLVRWSALGMAAGFALAGMWVEVAVSMLAALAQVVAWRPRMPWGWEIASSLTCMVAAVSSFLLLYERFPGWDKPVHAVLTGLLAVLAVHVLSASAPTTPRIIITGLLLAATWELLELAGHHWVDPTVHVAPLDTVTDLLAGLVGAVGAALLWRRR